MTFLKSLESYYQETVVPVEMVAKDIVWLIIPIKMLKNRKIHVGETSCRARIGFALLQEVVAMPKLMSRRKFCCITLVKNSCETGEGADMDDNVRNPKVKVEANIR
jgi:ATP-dependent DNA helicase RecQ